MNAEMTPEQIEALRRVVRAADRWLCGDDSEEDPVWAGLRPGDIECLAEWLGVPDASAQ